MKHRLYLAKPDDKTQDLTREESRFLHTMNLKTPENTYLSYRNYWNRSFERLPDGMPQYFSINGVGMEYVYPLEDRVVALSDADFSIPILQPFRHVNFQNSLLNFDRIVLLDDYAAKVTIEINGLEKYVDKFCVLNHSGGTPFMIYNDKEGKQEFVKYYALADRLIAALKTGDWSALKYEHYKPR